LQTLFDACIRIEKTAVYGTENPKTFNLTAVFRGGYEMEEKALREVYWKLHDCREIIRSTEATVNTIGAAQEHQTALDALQAMMDKIPPGEMPRDLHTLKKALVE